ncbi:hypothetical protein PE36_17705 [Moritella sp. PE36]|nr:hypothetical protein PE36_17705 [Moritella sp. PE36]
MMRHTNAYKPNIFFTTDFCFNNSSNIWKSGAVKDIKYFTFDAFQGVVLIHAK